jgi:hypothetical protein
MQYFQIKTKFNIFLKKNVLYKSLPKYVFTYIDLHGQTYSFYLERISAPGQEEKLRNTGEASCW